MMYIILGPPGAGKTLLMSYLAYVYHESGYNIYSNFQLKFFEYFDISAITDFLQIKTAPNFFCLDELWLSADSRRSGSFQNMMSTKTLMQHRKMEADVALSSQLWMQNDSRFRGISQMVFEPEIPPECVYEGKPIGMLVHCRMKGQKTVNTFPLPLLFDNPDDDDDVLFACDYYDTNERMDALNTGEGMHLEELVDKYQGIPYKKVSQLRAFILIEEHKANNYIKEKEASNVAQYIDILRHSDE